MAKLDQAEQRINMALRRKKSALQNAISNANVQKRLAESPSESSDKRSAARTKYESLQKEVANLRQEVKTLENDLSKERGRKEAIKVKENYDNLKEQYDLIIDKTSPEAQAIAERVNSEVKKLNAAYEQSGSSTRVFPVTEQAVTSATQSAAEKGRAATRATKTTATGRITGGTAGGVTGGATGGATGAAAGGTAGGKGGKGDGDKTPKLTAEERYAQALTKAQELYQMPDIIFKNVDSLKTLLRRFVDKELTIDQFVKEIQNDVWYRQNSQEIKARYIQLFNYEDLVNTGQARGTTNYEQEIDRIVRDVQAEARTMRGAEVDDADARAIAKDLYIFNQDKDRSVIRERIARFIKPVAGMIAGQLTQDYGGEALQNYQALQGLAKANGFNLADILPKDATGKAMTAQSTLQAIATGKLDVNRIAQDVRKLAAVGQSDFVKELLGQGYNLEDAYSPYKQRMADILEIDPSAINLRDPALMMAINKDGDMNLFDYERALRKDARWQYTERARNEATGVAMNILRNFGFQG